MKTEDLENVKKIQAKLANKEKLTFAERNILNIYNRRVEQEKKKSK